MIHKVSQRCRAENICGPGIIKKQTEKSFTLLSGCTIEKGGTEHVRKLSGKCSAFHA